MVEEAAAENEDVALPPPNGSAPVGTVNLDFRACVGSEVMMIIILFCCGFADGSVTTCGPRRGAVVFLPQRHDRRHRWKILPTTVVGAMMKKEPWVAKTAGMHRGQTTNKTGMVRYDN